MQAINTPSRPGVRVCNHEQGIQSKDASRQGGVPRHDAQGWCAMLFEMTIVLTRAFEIGRRASRKAFPRGAWER
ncbi:DUF1534 domain-containing protein [Pseudomonas sp. KBS0707]|nr:DUF1534 domain-containing protein [Pseudomonas sp. KBS0707]